MVEKIVVLGILALTLLYVTPVRHSALDHVTLLDGLRDVGLLDP